MLSTILAAIVVVAIVIVAMAVGVIFGRPALRGSCGGSGTACECSSTEREACDSRKGADEQKLVDVANLRR